MPKRGDSDLGVLTEYATGERYLGRPVHGERRRATAIVAHADDEVLGCGATLARLVDEGWDTRIIVATDGIITTRPGRTCVDNIRCAARAADVLGTPPPRFLGFPDQHLDEEPIAKIVNAITPWTVGTDLIFTHSRADLNVDHRIVAEAIAVATRPSNAGSTVLACEVPGEATWNGVPFTPNLHVDVTNHLPRKLAAFAEYRTEVRQAPHPRSVEAVKALAAIRGSLVGLPFVESFELVRGYPGALNF